MESKHINDSVLLQGLRQLSVIVAIVSKLLHVLVILGGVFGLAAAVVGWQLRPLRIAVEMLFIIQGFSAFPIPKEDRHKTGLVLGCVCFVLGGLVSLWTGSWIPLPVGLGLAYVFAFVLPPNPVRELLSKSSQATGVSFSDNFEYIAFNMALIHHALKSNHANRFADEESLLVTCAVMDTIMHIGAKHFTVQDVKDGLVSAKLGQCSLGVTSIPIEGHGGEVAAFFCGVPDLFLNYTLQIEAMIFYADERFLDPIGLSERDIILAVLDKRDDIARVLDTPKDKLAQNKMAAGVRQAAATFMDSPNFADFRREIGLE